ncbi:bacteriodes thetaiotaomicron symbiotic chitinase [Penicillium samsonianum]|uniref:bacteriodes thetaiotaomicron symbiotic chitinase n=1 Tax=Penicillium samsonianum TaxID=1882272 RepID=UPI002548A0F2|nr:bacteriodes thetaiotaomicron symbiotic chitinase [Penicillium samsonianum]KAJ6142824.1 bacteriodes thetaiotaomicron symbiotic chitinase [Penicillium samsonianum]
MKLTSLSIPVGGYCGYGSTYCGTGCNNEWLVFTSQSPGLLSNDKSTDFCDDTTCQSNCGLHPTPQSGSPKNQILSKVIGYYEAWNDRSKCHQTSPSDLPLDALTHLNYAFAYINPSTFQIMTMDAATPVSLFDDLAALKLTKADLKIFVSIGGWTFSDNNMATQAVFGNIAKSSTNRQTFAKNVLSFLNEYGFDGVDIDCCSKSFVALSKIPDGTWVSHLQLPRLIYMRWFDLPGMLKYADWMNLMSYDLHGVWDSSNPIGSVVQAHTNLTEIKLATELLWRAKVKPSQVAMGFGFYGRSFTLESGSCTTPGCAFSGGGNAGICTDTSGYLAYYEIQQILSNNSDIKVIHDKEAAVKYFTWDTNQWISYDDEDTFKQKIDWANSIGFSGSLIWASDLDDYNWTAHKALTGKDDLGSSVSLLQADEQQPLVDVIETYLGGGCYKFHESFDLDNPQAASCSPLTMVGHDKAGCTCGKPICCPKTSGLKNCQWRGGPAHGDCNGQCHAGEVQVSSSSWGGIPGQSGTGKCGRGGKALCCEMGSYDLLLGSCYWSKGVNSKCKDDEESVAYQWDRTGWGTTISHGNHYCCPKSEPIPVENCHWVGKGDCADNTCKPEEITLATNDQGDTYGACSWGRKKALCCSPNPTALETLTCDADLCSDFDEGCDEEDGFARSFKIAIDAITGSSLFKDGMKTLSRPYPPGLKVFKGDGSSTLGLAGGFSMLQDVCSSTAVQLTKYADLPKKGSHAEHMMELNMIPKFLVTTLSGVLPNGNLMKAAKIDPANLLAGWNKVYDVSLPLAGQLVTDVKGWAAPMTPNDRVFEILGSYAYRTGMSFLEAEMNIIKMTLWMDKNPMAIGVFNDHLKTIAGATSKSPEDAAKKLLGVLQKTIGVYNYLNYPELRPHLNEARAAVQKEFGYADKYARVGGHARHLERV